MAWLRSQPHATKIVIAGNHDLILDANFPQKDTSASGEAIDWGDIIYLQDPKTTITCDNGRRLRIYEVPILPSMATGPFSIPALKISGVARSQTTLIY